MMNELGDIPEAGEFLDDQFDDAEVLEFWSTSELMSLSSLPRNQVISCPALNIRQQLYRLDHPKLRSNEIRRAEGMSLSLSLRDYLLLEIEDAQQQSFILAVHPDWVWKSSAHLITPELSRWAVDHAPEIIGFIEYSLIELFDFFDWIPRGISRSPCPEIENPVEDALYINDEKSTQLIAFGSSSALNRAELVLRAYSTNYRKNCLWLGQSIFYELRLNLLLSKTAWKLSEISSVSAGDLLYLQQRRRREGLVELRAKMISSSTSTVQWTREVNFTMTDKDAKIHIGNTSWERVEQSFDDDGDNLLSESLHSDSDLEYESNAASPSLLSSQRIVEGVSGPEDVVLEVIAGVTQVDFNELCNIQDGSLIELQSHTLPMVKLAVRGVPILEGELVRFKEVLMVQVTRRISNGSRDD
ncbi:MAG: FliM/FliN family flagellar motor C-terminal domain-containing protein [Limnobacter sp.]|jgi:flagellar motor switch/type III secretory pathway protein FliN|uniref:FliM/FliN family flagellar motor C-terminal domain-containing protein n=1 Tax=Limnobacter sp. TaxID=2003368 RepID=UPI0040376FE2